jgi:integrase
MEMRRIHRLTDRQAQTAKAPVGRPAIMLPDGGSLYLRVSHSTSVFGGFNKSWVFRYERDGKRRDLGLGPYPTITLAMAREKAHALRVKLIDGIDPAGEREQRQAERLAQRAAEAKAMTFRQCAVACISAHEASWRNAEHRRQWSSSLEQYVYPVFGDLPVDQIDVAHVVKVLDPIWSTIPETASRVRGRIEKVLGWATVRGFRSGDNPARWRGHLEELFSAKAKANHHAALPYTELPAFMCELRGRDNLSGGPALEFLILTAARSGEVLGATWDEIDLAARTWTIPGERMKAGKAHKVPLSDRALEILRSLPRTDARVFPIHKKSFAWVLDSLHVDVTTHGFRSSFRDWAAERTNFAREVCEQALAHAIPDKVEAAYRRGDLFEKRRHLMEAWAEWVSRPVPTGATVTTLAR